MKAQLELGRIFDSASSKKNFKNFEIQKYYQKEPKFNGINSKNNLPKVKNGQSVGTPWISLYVNAEYVTYFHSFGV